MSFDPQPPRIAAVPIDFTCPHCGAKTYVADEFAGQTGPCVQCGKTITLPPAPPLPASDRRHGGRSTAIAFGGCLLVVGLFALVAGALVFGLLLKCSAGPF